MADDQRSQQPRRIESDVERRLRELAEQGELRDLPGQGQPFAADGGPDDETWAARHIMRQANAVPPWIDLRREIDYRRARITRRLVAHHEWLHDRTRLLARLPADRIVDDSRATAARDQRVRAELEQAVSELNALIRRFDLLVTPALQLPLVTLDRLAPD